MPTGWLQHRPALCQHLWRDRKQKGTHLTGRHLQSPQTEPTCESHLPQLSWAETALASFVSKNLSWLQGRNTRPFSAIQPPLPSFLLPRIPLILIPTHVKQGQSMETEGTTLTTSWVGAFCLNCCLQQAWRSCEERGKGKVRKAICLWLRAKDQLMREVKPREKP